MNVMRQDDAVAAPGAATVALEDRVAHLRAVSAFALLPADVLESVGRRLGEERFCAGQAVLTEGETGDRLHIVVHGQAEATTNGPIGPSLLAAYGPGEVFGELALLTPDHVRHATVTAVTDLFTLTIDAATFGRVLVDYPPARDAFEEADEHLLIVKFLKAASPFARMDLDRIRRLAERVQPVQVTAGEAIVRQGEPGDTCYLLVTGQVSVLTSDEQGLERELAALGPGALVGEAALLTDAPRNATVRATERCELLRLRRTDLLSVLGSDQELGHELVELIRLRDRPRQAPDIVVGQRVSADGSIITTLKDPRRAVYYRLSPDGYFVWQRLDGNHTLRDLALEYMTTFKVFAPQAIADAIQGLAGAGFLETRSLRREVAASAGRRPSRRERLMASAGRVADWEVPLVNPDRWLSALYRGGVWLLYTRPAQVVLALIGLAGLAVFVANLGTAAHAATAGGWVLLGFFGLYFLMVVLHELGHAFTVKFFHRDVVRAGVGVYWFAPIAYVDTSDMWLADRWPRILVTLGGLYASALVASGSAIGAVLLGHSVVAVALWQLAFLSYYAVLTNLNPLMELDGYYLLMDYLDHPNLRAHCLRWLGHELPKALRSPVELGRHKLELCYGLGSTLYVVLSSYILLVAYRTVVEGWLSSILPFQVAAVVAWILMGMLVAVTLVTLAGELRSMKRNR